MEFLAWLSVVDNKSYRRYTAFINITVEAETKVSYAHTAWKYAFMYLKKSGILFTTFLSKTIQSEQQYFTVRIDKRYQLVRENLEMFLFL
jgi:hypothetical protein